MSESETDSLNLGYPHILGRRVYETNDKVNVPYVTPDLTPLLINEDSYKTFVLTFADFGSPYGQTLPAGTTIQVTVDGGSLIGESSFTVPDGIGTPNELTYGGQEFSFSVKNPNTAANVGDSPIPGFITIKATTPKGTVTMMAYTFSLEGL
jgi:hypothetical protein